MKSIFTLLCFCSLLTASAQNTGIGTTTPEVRLHVVDSASDAAIRVESATASHVAQLQAKTKGGVFDVLQLQKWSPGSSGTVAGISLDNLSTVLAGVQAGGLAVGTQTNNPLYFLTNNLEQMRITNAGNVGIGTRNPVERLYVTGNVRATDFTYTNPKTSYYSLSSGDFNAKIGAEVVRRDESSDGGAILESGSNGLIAAVHLPHGATLTRITVYYYRNSAVELNFRLRPTGSISSIASLSTSGASSGYGSVTTTTFSNPIINNSVNGYIFEAIPTASWPNYNLIVRKVVFEYTTSNP